MAFIRSSCLMLVFLARVNGFFLCLRLERTGDNFLVADLLASIVFLIKFVVLSIKELSLFKVNERCTLLTASVLV
ncbi:Uncharacterised protein [Yersinia enterocolitica]|nr:Uncharacterised protein [Yersinia enterocolitica]